MSESTLIDQTLKETVSQLESKADRIEQSKDTEKRVKDASEQIGRISRRLSDVTDSAEELRFYIRLYTKAFNNGSGVGGNIQPLTRSALENVEISDDELLEAAKDRRLSDLEDQVEEAEGDIEDAIERARNALKRKQTDWSSDLEAAQELGKIVGGESEFQDLITKMQRFLDSEMWDIEKDPSQLATDWQRYERQWKKNTDKQGWDTFKEEHDLNKSTISALRQFEDGDPVRLSDLSVTTLEEIKRVPELESALQLEVRS